MVQQEGALVPPLAGIFDDEQNPGGMGLEADASLGMLAAFRLDGTLDAAAQLMSRMLRA